MGKGAGGDELEEGRPRGESHGAGKGGGQSRILWAAGGKGQFGRAQTGGRLGGGRVQVGMWRCPRCGANTFAIRPSCFTCGGPRPSAPVQVREWWRSDFLPIDVQAMLVEGRRGLRQAHEGRSEIEEGAPKGASTARAAMEEGKGTRSVWGKASASCAQAGEETGAKGAERGPIGGQSGAENSGILPVGKVQRQASRGGGRRMS